MATGSYSDTFGGGNWQGYGQYLETKSKRIANQLKEKFQKDTKDAAAIFQNCVFWLDGRTRVPEYRLKMLMVRHAGEYESYNLSRVTHVVADNLAVGNKRWREIRDKGRGNFFVVTSEWILACVEKGSRIQESYFTPDSLQPASGAFGSIFRFVRTNDNKKDPQASSSTTAQPLAADQQHTLKMLSESPSVSSTESASLTEPLASTLSVTSRSPALCTDDEPNFVEHFFKASRLHFIGRWRERILSRFTMLPFAPLPTGVVTLGSNMTPSSASGTVSTLKRFFKSTSSSEMSLSTAQSQTAVCSQLLHVDFDAFFVSVALQQHPELKHKPVAVCHGNSESSGSEIASCNYVARSYGVTKGMWMRNAKQLCPHLCTLPYDFEAIEKVSLAMFDVLTDVTARVHPMSCDEAFVQLVGPVETKLCESVAEWIRNEVFKRTGCYVSVGIGPNLMLAKLAGQRAKPPHNYNYSNEHVGIYRVYPPYADFMSSVPLRDLPGIGQRALEKLGSLGLSTCADVRSRSSLAELQTLLGNKTGETCYAFCNGCDPRPIPVLHSLGSREGDGDRSLTVSVNWGIRLTTDTGVQNFLRQMARECQRRLHQSSVVTHDLTLKILRRAKDAPAEPIKYGGCGECDEFCKRVAVPIGVHDADQLFEHFYRLWKRILASEGCPIPDLRGVSVVMTKLKRRPLDRCSSSSPVSQPSAPFAPRLDTTAQCQSIPEMSSLADDAIVPTDVTVAETPPVMHHMESISSPLFLCSSLENPSDAEEPNRGELLDDMNNSKQLSHEHCIPDSAAKDASLTTPRSAEKNVVLQPDAKKEDEGICDDDDGDDDFPLLTLQPLKMLAAIFPSYSSGDQSPSTLREQPLMENAASTVSYRVCEVNKADALSTLHEPTRLASLGTKRAANSTVFQAPKRSRLASSVLPAKSKTRNSKHTDSRKPKTQPTLFQLVQKAATNTDASRLKTTSSSVPKTSGGSNVSNKMQSRLKPIERFFKAKPLEIVDLDDDDDDDDAKISIRVNNENRKDENSTNKADNGNGSKDDEADGNEGGDGHNNEDPDIRNREAVKSVACLPTDVRSAFGSISSSPSDLCNTSLTDQQLGKFVRTSHLDEPVPCSETSSSTPPTSKSKELEGSFLTELLAANRTAFQTEQHFSEMQLAFPRAPLSLFPSKPDGDVCSDDAVSLCSTFSNNSEISMSDIEIELRYCPNVVSISLFPGCSDVSAQRARLSPSSTSKSAASDNESVSSFDSTKCYTTPSHDCDAKALRLNNVPQASVSNEEHSSEKDCVVKDSVPLSPRLSLTSHVDQENFASQKPTTLSTPSPSNPMTLPDSEPSVFPRCHMDQVIKMHFPPTLSCSTPSHCSPERFCDDLSERVFAPLLPLQPLPRLSTPCFDVTKLQSDVKARARMFHSSLSQNGAVVAEPAEPHTIPNSRYDHDVCGGARPIFLQLESITANVAAPFKSYVSWLSNGCWMCVAKELSLAYHNRSSMLQQLLLTHFSFTLILMCWALERLELSTAQPAASDNLLLTSARLLDNPLRFTQLPVILIVEELCGICACLELNRDFDICNTLLLHSLSLVDKPKALFGFASLFFLHHESPSRCLSTMLRRQLDFLHWITSHADHIQTYLFIDTLKALRIAFHQLIQQPR